MKAVKKHAVDPAVKAVKKHVVDPIKNVVTNGIDWFKKKVSQIAKGMLNSIVKTIEWSSTQFWDFMLRHPRDFTGFAIDGKRVREVVAEWVSW